MDPELKKLLEENLRLAQETNAMMASMKRQAQWGFWGKLVLYALVIIVPLFFLQSYLAPFQSLLGGGSGTDFNQLLDQYQAQNGQK